MENLKDIHWLLGIIDVYTVMGLRLFTASSSNSVTF